MTKTFCDRCGAEIKQHDYAGLNRRLIYVKCGLLSTKKYEDWKDDDRLICPQCEEEYIEWFKNPVR